MMAVMAETNSQWGKKSIVVFDCVRTLFYYYCNSFNIASFPVFKFRKVVLTSLFPSTDDSTSSTERASFKPRSRFLLPEEGNRTRFPNVVVLNQPGRCAYSVQNTSQNYLSCGCV